MPHCKLMLGHTECTAIEGDTVLFHAVLAEHPVACSCTPEQVVWPEDQMKKYSLKILERMKNLAF